MAGESGVLVMVWNSYNRMIGFWRIKGVKVVWFLEVQVLRAEELLIS